MRRALIILGTGGNTFDVLDLIDALNADAAVWDVHGFLDDTRPSGSEYLGLPVLGPLPVAHNYLGCLFINTIGSDQNFARRARIIASSGLESRHFVTLVHPVSAVSNRAIVGVGACINYGVSVGGRATVGDHVLLGPGAIVGHDAVIGDHSIVAPGAVISGGVVVGRSCYIGAGATVRQHIQIGEQSLVGMGAVVLRDVEAGQTVVGNPARTLSRNSTEEENPW